jgi:rubredoxin
MLKCTSLFALVLSLALSANAFAPPARLARPSFVGNQFPTALLMSQEPTPTKAVEKDAMNEAMDEVDKDTLKAMEKAKRSDELRAQEVFMTKSTGKHKCTNCDWEYDETKGDSKMIGGMIKPDTKFVDLPADWRCPVCRASKDAFAEVVEEIPGFAVNQGYGFGTNAWSAGQKNLAIFGGLGIFFVIFLSGYAMS